MKIYIITDGQYSNYHICGVATSPESAEALQEQLQGPYAHPIIEEFDTGAIQYTPGLFAWRVTMDVEGKGTVQRIPIDEQGPDTWEEDWQSNDYTLGMKETGRRHFVMLAHDEQHALKIANERRVQLIANNQWVTGVLLDETI